MIKLKAVRQVMSAIGIVVNAAYLSLPTPLLAQSIDNPEGSNPAMNCLSEIVSRGNVCQHLEDLRRCVSLASSAPNGGSIPENIQIQASTLIDACQQCNAAASDEEATQFINFAEGEAANPIEEIGKCCVCQYQDFSVCANRSESSCADTVTGRGGLGVQKDCIWARAEGVFSQPRCMSRFKKHCLDWKATMAGRCDKMFVTPRGTPVFQDVLCTGEIHYEHFGHGEGCYAFVRQVNLCVDAAGPACRRVVARHNGCSTFEDLTQAGSYMNDLRTRLRSEQRVNLSVSASGNQTIVSPNCRTELKFDVTCNDIISSTQPCHAEKTFCHVLGESALCRTPSGREVTQRCCLFCNPLPPSNGWTQEACHTLKSMGVCRGTAEAGSASAAEAAASQRLQQCLTQQRTRCNSNNRGEFVPSNYSVEDRVRSLTGYVATVKEDWTCCY